MVNAEMDVNLMESNGKSAHEHDASLTSDSSFFDNEQYLHNMNDDVETVPTNVSIGSTYSGKLYNYDDYFGSIDMNPETNTYDYGKWNTRFHFSFESLSNYIGHSNACILIFFPVLFVS